MRVIITFFILIFVIGALCTSFIVSWTMDGEERIVEHKDRLSLAEVTARGYETEFGKNYTEVTIIRKFYTRKGIFLDLRNDTISHEIKASSK